MTSAFNPIRLACSHGPDLHFDGKLIGEYTTQRKDGGKDRWTELRLWETPAGNWIAESVGCSTRQGEGEIREARVIGVLVTVEASSYDLLPLVPQPPWSPEDDPMKAEAMEAWGWTTAAKAFARELGWRVTRVVP